MRRMHREHPYKMCHYRGGKEVTVLEGSDLRVTIQLAETATAAVPNKFVDVRHGPTQEILAIVMGEETEDYDAMVVTLLLPSGQKICRIEQWLDPK